MHVILSIDTNNPTFPKNGLLIVQAELAKRISRNYPQAKVTVKSSSTNGFKFDDVKEAQQKIIKTLVEEMFDEADQWLVTDI